MELNPVPELSVLISTCRPDGIARVAAMGLPHVAGVHYWVSWQLHEGAAVPPELSGRDDITVLRTDSIGLSNNRNNLLDNACGKVFLIADDDLVYTAEQLQSVLTTFRDNPDVDYASFRYSGNNIKHYPAESCSLNPVPRYFYQTSIEVAIRNNVRTGRLRFNAEFGIGAPIFQSGEEELFFLQALRMGLNCRFFPITITRHDGPTTGERAMTRGTLMASGAVIFIQTPFTAIVRIPLKAWRLCRAGQASMLGALRFLTKGAMHVLCHRRLRALVCWRGIGR